MNHGSLHWRCVVEQWSDPSDPQTRSKSWIAPLLDTPQDFLSETGKVGYTYCQTKIAEMTLKVDQGHWQWHSSIGYIS